MHELTYNRNSAVLYAQKWAFDRNPAYLNFDNFGGDCTNFVSQCLHEGCKIMNHKKLFGWYYYDSYNRTPSWTGVEYLYNFLINNKGVGPYAVNSDLAGCEIGDIIQLGHSNGVFYHSQIITGTDDNDVYVATHTYDAYMRPLKSYEYDIIRIIHISGVRSI